MQINIEFDAKEFEANTSKQIRNLAYSTAQAINDTAKQIQSAVRADMEQQFTIRGERTGKFLKNQIKIFEWANVKQNRPYAVLGIVGNKPRLLLPMYETGGIREPFVGKSVAVPTTATAREGSIKKPVSPRLMFRALKMRRHMTKSGKAQWKGRERTFVVSKTAKLPRGGVLQRVGPGRDDIRLVYSFQAGKRLKKKLSFGKLSKDTYVNNFRENFLRRFYKLT